MEQQEKNIIEYAHSDAGGDARAVVYRLFPGVTAAYLSVRMAQFDFGFLQPGERKQYATIHYCAEGRMEREMEQEFFSVMPGDWAVSLRESSREGVCLPLRHYRGISIGIDLGNAKNPLFSCLESCGCSVPDMLGQMCGGRLHRVLRSSEGAGKLFEELYGVAFERRPDYLRAKLPELFLRMKYAQREENRPLVPRTQVELVKVVSDYITRNLKGKITMKQLTLEFGISDTYLQNAFRSVYGMPVIRFIRMQKMQHAAQVLIHTTRTVDEIAEEFGYENESKFSAAFKKMMGDPPGAYRRAHSGVTIL